MDIFERLESGEAMPMDHPAMGQLKDGAYRAFRILGEFNQTYSLEEARKVFGKLIGKKMPDSSTVYPPFHTNNGQNIVIGENVFINHDCSFLDLGGITVEDKVMIGPKVSINSENHPTEIQQRKTLVPSRVLIKRNAWIGANATILPGVTIGENSVVAAGAVVTKDVPENTVVAGVPAKVVKKL